MKLLATKYFGLRFILISSLCSSRHIDDHSCCNDNDRPPSWFSWSLFHAVLFSLAASGFLRRRSFAPSDVHDEWILANLQERRRVEKNIPAHAGIIRRRWRRLRAAGGGEGRNDNTSGRGWRGWESEGARKESAGDVGISHDWSKPL